MSEKHHIDQLPELEQAHSDRDCHCDGKCRNCRCRKEAEHHRKA